MAMRLGSRSLSRICQQKINVSRIAQRHTVARTRDRPLPDAKMRALIALYHQSQNWVTKHNVDQKINEAFAGDNLQQLLASDAGVEDMTLGDLQHELLVRRAAPQTVQAVAAESHRQRYVPMRTWSNVASERERKLVDALFGVHEGRLPGWETLKESAEELDQVLKKDKEDGERN